MDSQVAFDFNARSYPDRAGFKVAGTSQDAANAIEGSGRAANLRIAVLGFYARQSGTADECAEALGESILSIRPRCSELTTKGLLYKTGERRDGKAVLAMTRPVQGVAA